MLPNFIHAGVPKAASATLELIFKNHPEIYTSREKELNFFNNTAEYAKGIDWYENRFFEDTGNFPIVSDRSVGYSTGLARDVPKRILETLGDNVKFLFVLRHPVDRAYSQYCMARYKGQVDRLPFDESINRALSIRNEITNIDIDRVQTGTYYSNRRDLDIFRYCLYLHTGFYSRTLTNFSEYFDSGNILVLFVDDLARDQQAAANRVFDFLGVRQINVSGIERRNESQTLRHPIVKRIANGLYRFKSVRHVLSSSVSAEARRKLKRFFLSRNYAKNTSLPLPDLETQIKLQSFYYSDIERTQQITGRDLSDWLTKYPTN